MGVSFFFQRRRVIAFSRKVIILELGLHAAFFIMHYGKEEGIGDKRYLLPQFEGKTWAKDLHKEVEELSGSYQEFRGWEKKNIMESTLI